jgi:D-amino-acid oxidase
MMPSTFFFPNAIEEDPEQFDKMEEIIASGVRGFRRSAQIMEEQSVNTE